MRRFISYATATTQIYTLSLHDALPIYDRDPQILGLMAEFALRVLGEKVRRHQPELLAARLRPEDRSEEHTSELQSLTNLVCRLLLEKKKRHVRVGGTVRQAVARRRLVV